MAYDADGRPIFELVTLKQIKSIISDIEMLYLPKHIRCECKETYSLVMRRFSELHISTSGNLKELLIVA